MEGRFVLGGRILRSGIALVISGAWLLTLAAGTIGCSAAKGTQGQTTVAQAGTAEEPGEVSLTEAREEWRSIRDSLAALTSRAALTATATAECADLVGKAESLADSIPRARIAKGAFDPRPGLNRAVGSLKSQATAGLALVKADVRVHELQAEVAAAGADLAIWSRQVKVNPGVQYLVDEAKARRARRAAALVRARVEYRRLAANYKALAARAAEGAAAWEAI
jgi:hypothetical protein